MKINMLIVIIYIILLIINIILLVSDILYYKQKQRKDNNIKQEDTIYTNDNGFLDRESMEKIIKDLEDYLLKYKEEKNNGK